MTAAQLGQLIDRFLDPALSEQEKQTVAREVEAHLSSFPELRPAWQSAQNTLFLLGSARSFEAPAPPFLRSNVRAALVEEANLNARKTPFWLGFARPMWAGGALAALALLLVAKDYFGPNAPSLSERSTSETPDSAIVSQKQTERVVASRPSSAGESAPLSVLPTATPGPARAPVFVEKFQPAPDGSSRSKRAETSVPTAPSSLGATGEDIADSNPKSRNTAGQNKTSKNTTNKNANGVEAERARSIPSPKKEARKDAASAGAPRENALAFSAPAAPSPRLPARSILEPAPAENVAPPAPMVADAGPMANAARPQNKTLEDRATAFESAPSIAAPSIAAQLRAEADWDAAFFTLEVRELAAGQMARGGGETRARETTASRRVQVELRSVSKIENVRLLRGEEEIWRGTLHPQNPLRLSLWLPATSREIELVLEALAGLEKSATARGETFNAPDQTRKRVILRAPVSLLNRP